MGLNAPPPPAPELTRRALERARRAAGLPPASALGQVTAFVQIVLAAALTSAWLEEPTLVAVTVVALGGAIVVGEVSGLAPRFERVSGVLVAFAALAVLFVAHAVTDARLLGPQPWLPFLAIALVPMGLDWHFAPRLRARVVASGIVVVPLVGTGTAWSLAGALVWFLAALVTLAVLQRDAERAVLRPVHAADAPGAAQRWRYADIARIAAIGLALGAAVALLFGDLSCTGSSEGPGSVATGGAGGSATRPVPLPPGAGASPGDPVDPSSVIVEHDGETVTLRRGDGTSTVYEFDGEEGQIHVTERDETGAVVDEYSIDAADIRTRPDGTAVAPGPAEPQDEPTRWWLVAGAVLVAAGLAALGWWWWRQRTVAQAAPDDWAHRMAARLDREGERRGRARHAGETVEAYARALADGPLPDPRVVTVGQLVSAALFGPRPPDADQQAWADAAVDDVTAQHPPERSRRRRTSPTGVSAR